MGELRDTKAMFGVITLVRVADCWQGRVDLVPINRTLSPGTSHIRSPGGASSLSSGGLKLTRLAGLPALWWHLIGGGVRGRVGGNCKIAAGHQKLLLSTTSFLSFFLI